jgi:hypothetical protein
MKRRQIHLSVLFLCCTFSYAQSVAFEFPTLVGSPVTLVSIAPDSFRSVSDRRQFLVVKNESEKVTAAVVFQQTIGSGPHAEIVTLERVSVLIRPGEKKRLSVSVRDVWNQLQTANKTGETIDKPVLSVAVVEFTDGSSWSPPAARTREETAQKF